jgi:caffeoyl-CoA O-methyltransferase
MQIVSPEVEAYAEAHTTPPPRHLATLAAQTRASLECPQMLTGEVEGRFLEMLVWAAQPRLVVELGTYSGFSALFMAGALDDAARLITCELDAERAAFAQRAIDQTPLAERIEIRIGPALESLAGIEGPIDLAFIDADKPGYTDYYEAIVPKLSDRGLIVADNTLRGGGALEGDEMHAFNEHVLGDERTACVLLPVRDGVTLIRRADRNS